MSYPKEIRLRCFEQGDEPELYLLFGEDHIDIIPLTLKQLLDINAQAALILKG